LCRSYWYPLYAYVRRKGHSPHDAQDITQDFFARFLEKHYIDRATPDRGRFRSFLLKSLDRFMINDWVRNNAQKRGGGLTFVPIEGENAEGMYQKEPLGTVQAEVLYDKRWATTLLQRAVDQLCSEYHQGGKSELFAALKGNLLTGGLMAAQQDVGAQLGLSEGALKVALHRLRSRFRTKVRAEVEKTVATPEEIDAEMQYLIRALSS
jgi:hypothetical protein